MGPSEHLSLIILGLLALSVTFVYSERTRDHSCPCPPCLGTIPLEQFQLDEIGNANREMGLGDREATYANRDPIVTSYTNEQIELMSQMFSPYLNNSRPENPTVMTIRKWDDDVGEIRKKRNPMIRACPAYVVDNLLVTAFDEDDNLIEIVQIPNQPQHVLREVCSSSPPAVNGIQCVTNVHYTYVVAFHLLGSGVGNIQVLKAQIEACTGVVL